MTRRLEWDRHRGGRVERDVLAATLQPLAQPPVDAWRRQTVEEIRFVEGGECRVRLHAEESRRMTPDEREACADFVDRAIGRLAGAGHA